MLRDKKNINLSDDCKAKIDAIENTFLEDDTKPKFPYKEGPRDYQIEAYQNWIKNNKKGIFAMATGTGKTITALNCLLNEYEQSNTYQSVIIVPTLALVSQWEKECQKFNFNNI
jgi:superfamily II DNA or RNA helicase